MKKAHLSFSGSPASSSHKPSSPQRCRTTHVRVESPSIELLSNSTLKMTWSIRMSLRSLKSVFTLMDCSWRAASGTMMSMCWRTRKRRSSSLRCHWFISCLLLIVSRLRLEYTIAQFIRCFLELVLYPLLVTLLTMWSWWRFLQKILRRNGSRLVLLVSLLLSSEHLNSEFVC